MIADELLIEIFLYNNCPSLYSVINAKAIALSEIRKLPDCEVKDKFIYRNNRAIFAIIYDKRFLFYRTYMYSNIHKLSYVAAEYNRERELSFLIDKGARNYKKILFHAAKGDNRELVNRLLKSVVYGSRNIIVKGAAEGNRVELLHYMITTYSYNDWTTIAYCAAKGGYKELVEKMIKKIVKIDYVRIASGYAKGGHIALLYDMIKDYNITDWNSIAISAAKGGHMSIVNEMIRLGVDENKEGMERIKFLYKWWNKIAYAAAKYGHKEIFCAMLARIRMDNRNGEIRIATWRMAAKSAAKGENTSLLKELLSHISIDDHDWDIIVRYAVEGGNLNTVKFAINEGYDNDEKVLILARYHGHFDIVNYINGIKENIYITMLKTLLYYLNMI